MSGLLWPNAETLKLYYGLPIYIVKAKETFILQYPRSISDDPSCCNYEKSTMSYLCSVQAYAIDDYFTLMLKVEPPVLDHAVCYFRDISGDSGIFSVGMPMGC